MEFTRNCPICDKQLNYSSKDTLQKAIRENRSCRSCTNAGEDNPFYGKTHSIEVKEKIKKTKELSGYAAYKTPEFRAKISELSSGAKNPMSGKSVYSVWLEKYGKEIADKKQEELCAKRSLQMTGSKNHMYGKPTPQGSGNGWKGWYKEHFFRSLRELNYMIQLTESNKEWSTAETQEFRIPYKDYKGTNRTYAPDFLVDNEVIEVKPEKLIKGSSLIKAKTAAAKEYFEAKGMTYKIIDPGIPSDDKIRELYLSGEIKFQKRYEDMYKERYLN